MLIKGETIGIIENTGLNGEYKENPSFSLKRNEE
jgi:hypothetical protein